MFTPSQLIAEGWPACLRLRDNFFVWGDFSSVNQTDCTAIYRPQNPADLQLLTIGEEYAYLDSYWGQRAVLATNTSHTWSFREFTPSNATESRVPDWRILRKLSPTEPASPDETVIPAGWDHEHCEICWESIGGGGDQPKGYVNEDDQWVCLRCYENFIARRSLNFVEQV